MADQTELLTALFQIFYSQLLAQTKTSPTSLRAAGSSGPATTSSNKVPKTTAATEDEDAKPAALATTSKK